jgi:ABC-type branched-subunit amino acid transport system substrate-binding protein
MLPILSSLLLSLMAQGVSADTILIGMEREANSFSVDEENLGMHLAIRDINAKGGIHGRGIEVKAYSRGTDNPVDRAVANAKRLVEEDGVFLLFNFGGPAAIRIGEYAMARDVPYLFPHTALLTVDGDRHVFTSFPRYAGESRMMLNYLATERQAKRIAIVYADNVYGEYFAERTTSLAAELDYEFVGGQALANDAVSAMSQVEQLRSLDPDVVIMALYPAGARRVVEAKAALGWQIDLVSSGPLTDEQYLSIEGGHADGTLGFCHYPDPNESVSSTGR